MNMIIRSVFAATLLVAAMLVTARSAEAADIRVLCSNGLREVVNELVPRFERTSGHKVVLVFDPSTQLKKRIDAGEPFDLAVLTTALIDEEVKAGKLASPRTVIARTGLGLSMRAGAKKPDISTVDAFKRALLGAKSISYATQGAAAGPFQAIVEKLGLTAQLKPKYASAETGAQVGEAVVSGRAEIGVAPVSEILPVKGIELVGAFPAEIQSFVEMTAAVGASAKDKAAARELITFLTAPASVPVIKAKGMEAASVRAGLPLE